MARIRGTNLGLPKGWKTSIRSAVLSVISLARYSMISAQGWTSHCRGSAVEVDRLRIEVAQLQEEIRIKDARMAHLSPQRRPHYSPTERMAILELRAARGWSLARAAVCGPLGCRSPIRSAGLSAGWIAVVVDHFSRRAMGTTAFRKQPTSSEV